MLKRLITAAVGVVGAAVVGLGVASATVWRADDVLVADVTGTAPVVVTDPGVLELGGDPVTVTVTAPGDAPVVVAVGRDTDVAGWVGTDAHTVISGLAEWHVLATDEIAATDEEPSDAASEEPPAPVAEATEGAEGEQVPDPSAVLPADPTGSDLWVVEQTGTGSVELVWPATAGRWSLIAVSPSGEIPTVSLAWPRTVTTPWLWPCVAVGSLLVLGALAVALRGVRRRRAPEPAWTPVTTGSTPVVPAAAGQPMTRRQLREAALSGGVQSERPVQAGVSAQGSGRRAAAEPSPSARPQAAAPPVPPAVPAPPPGRDVPAGPAGTSASSDTPSVPLRDRLSRRAGTRGAQQAAPSDPVAPAGPRDQSGPSWPRSVGAPAPDGPVVPGEEGLRGRPASRTVAGGHGPGAGGSRADAPSGVVVPNGGSPSTALPAAGRSTWPAPTSPPSRPGGPVATQGQVVPPAGPAREPGPVPHGRPAWAARPGVPGGTPPSAAPVSGPAAAPASAPAPAARPAGDARVAPPAPTAPPGVGARPGGWSPTLPPPGATLRPGAGTGPDDPHAAAGRPAWLASGRRPDQPTQGEPTTARPAAPVPGDAEPSGSRADAWRRAWGLPQGESGADEQRDERGEESR